MKANPGYKWCPPTNKPVKTQSPTLTNRKKLWAFPSEVTKDLSSPKKLMKTEETPQLNFAMAGKYVNPSLTGIPEGCFELWLLLVERKKKTKSPSYIHLPSLKPSYIRIKPYLVLHSIHIVSNCGIFSSHQYNSNFLLRCYSGAVLRYYADCKK